MTETIIFSNSQNFATYLFCQKKTTLFLKKDIEYNFTTKVTLRCVTINCISPFLDKMAYFFKILAFSSNFHKTSSICHVKTAFLAIFWTLIDFFVLLSCSNPRTTIYFLKATCLSFHLSYITYLYLENYSSQNFDRHIAGQ